jgi:ABC-type antimicrobial peptide transport system ATPase subunit
MVDEALYFSEKDVGKKVYEMECEITYAIKWQILAEDKNQAFKIWLENHKVDIATEDGKDVVCSYVKDYTQINSTKEIAKIKLDIDNDEVIADES